MEAYGFEVNLYDSCVANTNVSGKKMTVTWHVENLKVSHMESLELQKFCQYLRDNFRDVLT